MFQKIKSILNKMIMGSLILVFEHISHFSFFGFMYPWIGLILISFIVYFALTMPIFFKRPKARLLPIFPASPVIKINFFINFSC